MFLRQQPNNRQSNVCDWGNQEQYVGDGREVGLGQFPEVPVAVEKSTEVEENRRKEYDVVCHHKQLTQLGEVEVTKWQENGVHVYEILHYILVVESGQFQPLEYL